MSDPTNDIDALLDALVPTASGFGDCEISRADARRYHAALTALVAERNKLVEDNASQTYKGNSVCYWHDKANAYKATIGSLWEILESAAVRPDGERTITTALTALVAERDSLKQRVAELEALSKPVYISHGQRVESIDLRERLVCAIWPEIMRQWREYTGGIDPQYTNAIDPRGNARSDALAEADAMIAAMRKGEA